MSPEEASTRTTADETAGGFTEAERAAMKERSKELRAAKGGKKADPEADVLAKIAEMSEPDRSLAERLHALVKEHAPSLTPRTWYGMPAWANGDGKVVCFLTPAGKFDSRYASFGFNDAARLDDGTVWPTSFAVTRLTKADEDMLAALIRKSIGQAAA